MEKVRLGKTNIMVSKIGFGGIPIQRLSETDAVSVVRKCLELGINFLDTANDYTNSEERIGKAILGCRESLILGTKTMGRTRKEVENHLKLSLERLGTDYIDLYQIHNISDLDTLKKVLAPDGPMAVVTEAKRLGQIRHVGVTSHSLDIAKELVKLGYFETIMFPLNFITFEAANELIPLAKERDVGFIAMKPLEGGRLDNVDLAFKYLFQFPDVVTIVGIEKIKEIEEIAEVLNKPSTISESEEAQIERLRNKLGTTFCRRCDYCQPCVQEIPISVVMDYPSLFNRLPPEGIFSDFVAEAMEKAAHCTKCGDCEERCPYSLPIQEMMENYVTRYEEGKASYLKQKACK